MDDSATTVRHTGARYVIAIDGTTGFLEKNHDWDELVDQPTPAILEAVRARSAS